jgi:hypothetical protein
MTEAQVPPASGKTELKVKAASWATFLVSLAGLTLLESSATDLVPALPQWANWLTPIIGAAIATATTWLTGYNVRNRPAELSQSTIDAVQQWMRNRAPRLRGDAGGGGY